MKKFNCINLFLLLTVTVFFASCGDDYYTDDFLRNSNEKLCGYNWVEGQEYFDINNSPILKVRILYFNQSSVDFGKGKESFEYYRGLPNGKWADTPYRTESSTFDWRWIENFEGLELDFGDEIVLFENVWVREYYLSGKYDDYQATFYRE